MRTNLVLITVSFFAISTFHDTALSKAPTMRELNQYCHATLNGNLQPEPTPKFKGKLCAIDPTVTHPDIINPSMSAGYGFHVVGIPDNLSANTPVWVHFAGAYGKPYDDKEGFKSQLWMGEVVNQGYLVIGLAVDNSFSLNKTFCENTYEDGCVWKIREEIAAGEDFSKHVSTFYLNSILGRMIKLGEYLHAKGFPLPNDAAINNHWQENLSKTMLSGHSQGAGTAFYIAKWQAVRGVCGFGGPGDPADLYKPYIDENGKMVPDWIVDGKPVNPIQHYFGTSLDSDEWYTDHEARWKAYGLKKQNNYEILPVAGQTLTDINGVDISHNGHGAIMGAVELSAHRAKCFSRAKPRQ